MSVSGGKTRARAGGSSSKWNVITGAVIASRLAEFAARFAAVNAIYTVPLVKRPEHLEEMIAPILDIFEDPLAVEFGRILYSATGAEASRSDAPTSVTDILGLPISAIVSDRLADEVDCPRHCHNLLIQKKPGSL
jgi:hypothetical protein